MPERSCRMWRRSVCKCTDMGSVEFSHAHSSTSGSEQVGLNPSTFGHVVFDLGLSARRSVWKVAGVRMYRFC